MKYKLLIAYMFVACLTLVFTTQALGQGKTEGKVNWVEGYISAVGVGTATPSGNRVKDELRAVRAATILGQRALLETVKGVKIDSQKKIEDKMTQEETVNTRIEGTIRGAEIVKESVRWEGDRPVAKVELRICLGGFGACKSENSIMNVLALDKTSEQSNAPSRRLADIEAKPKQQNISQGPKKDITDIQTKQGSISQEQKEVIYDSSRPVTGIIFNLQGMFFERVILPVVITIGDDNTALTVYSVKSVEPQVVRTYGATRYFDSVDQARQNPYLGDNVIIVPVAEVTKENILMIGYHNARIIRETTRYGNDYLKSAKVFITSR